MTSHFIFFIQVPNWTHQHYFLIIYSATDSFISLEKGLLQLFRKKIFHELLKQMQNSQLATSNTHGKILEFHCMMKKMVYFNAIHSYSVFLYLSSSSVFFTMLPEQTRRVTVRIYLLWARFVLTKQYFDSLFNFVWLITFTFQLISTGSKNTLWKCQFCCNTGMAPATLMQC